MSDQIQPTPRAQTSIVTPTPAAATQASHSISSSPTTADAAPQTTTTTTIPSTTTPAAPTPEEESLTLNKKLNNTDRYWKFKGVLQVLAIIFGLIGIGTIGWCVSTTPINDSLTYGYSEYWTLWPSLVTFTVSIIWCVACLVGLVVRKRPVHPGLRTAIDLLLWLSFLVTALFALVSVMELLQWGEYGTLGDTGFPSRHGDYELQANGTWVWEDSRDSGSTSFTRSCDRSSSSYGEYGFKDCAEQDAYVNRLWQAKPHRESVKLTGVVCQFASLVIHFILFVWACVDCHRYNRTKVSKDAEKVAANIVQTMITNGAIIPPPRQAHVGPVAAWSQPQMGYYQLPPQGQMYPMAAMRTSPGQPMQQQYPVPQGMQGPVAGSVAGPSNEKGVGPRYA